MHAGNRSTELFALRQALILEVAELVVRTDVLKETATFRMWRPDDVEATGGNLDWWAMTLLLPDDGNAEWKRLRRRLGLSTSTWIGLQDSKFMVIGEDAFGADVIVADEPFYDDYDDTIPEVDVVSLFDVGAIIHHPGLHAVL